MKRRIAIILDSINHKEFDKEIKIILLFDMNEKAVTAIGRQLINIYDINYLIIWLLGKRVKEVYMDHPEKILEATLRKCDIIIYPLSKIKDNPLFCLLDSF